MGAPTSRPPQEACPADLGAICPRIVHEHIETNELTPDALCRGGNRILICNVELEGMGILADTLRGRLPFLEIAGADEHNEAP